MWAMKLLAESGDPSVSGEPLQAAVIDEKLGQAQNR